MSQFVDRMIRAAKLDVQVYEEVETDKNAMGQAVGVVLLSSLAGGIGVMHQAWADRIVDRSAGVPPRLVCLGFFHLHHWQETSRNGAWHEF